MKSQIRGSGRGKLVVSNLARDLEFARSKKVAKGSFATESRFEFSFQIYQISGDRERLIFSTNKEFLTKQGRGDNPIGSSTSLYHT